MVVAAAATLLVSRTLTPDLVNYVVCNAFLQKAPPGFSDQDTREIFARAYNASRSGDERRRAYLEILFAVSQKLEKVQRLSANEAQDLLERIRMADERK